MKADSQDAPNNKDISQEDALKAMAGDVDVTERREAVAAFDAAGSPNIAARATNRNATAARNFKRTMIPLLIVVGGLLLIMGAAVAVLDATGRLQNVGDSAVTGGAFRTVLVYSAFPLGIILFVGAWMFHKETKSK
ncbi:MAG: hypothetical protein EHM48_05640 [Planctomycetaceae bacterium]|nr:MAG: hypothetical protein EHM48_05640 [Planctomycetaceae bacterium]